MRRRTTHGGRSNRLLIAACSTLVGAVVGGTVPHVVGQRAAGHTVAGVGRHVGGAGAGCGSGSASGLAGGGAAGGGGAAQAGGTSSSSCGT